MKNRRYKAAVGTLVVLTTFSVTTALLGHVAIAQVALALLGLFIGLLVVDNNRRVRRSPKRRIRRSQGSPTNDGPVSTTVTTPHMAEKSTSVNTPPEILGTIRTLQAQHVARLDQAQVSLSAATESLERLVEALDPQSRLQVRQRFTGLRTEPYVAGNPAQEAATAEN